MTRLRFSGRVNEQVSNFPRASAQYIMFRGKFMPSSLTILPRLFGLCLQEGLGVRLITSRAATAEARRGCSHTTAATSSLIRFLAK